MVKTCVWWLGLCWMKRYAASTNWQTMHIEQLSRNQWLPQLYRKNWNDVLGNIVDSSVLQWRSIQLNPNCDRICTRSERSLFNKYLFILPVGRGLNCYCSMAIFVNFLPLRFAHFSIEKVWCHDNYSHRIDDWCMEFQQRLNLTCNLEASSVNRNKWPQFCVANRELYDSS